MLPFKASRPLAAIHTAVWLTVLWFCATVVRAEAGENSDRVSVSRPSVLFIAVDDLNDWVGCLGGHPQAKTPNIDRLAARGVLFANAHCQATICNPSRVSLMTGTRPSSSGIYLLGPTDFRRASPLLADRDATPTLPEHLANNGYATLGVGKIYHAKDSRETFHTYGSGGGFGPFPAARINRPDGVKLWDWGRFPARDEQMADHGVADWAIEQLTDGLLSKRDDQPFFLAVGFARPHVPLYAPPKWFELYGAEDDIQLPATLDSDGDDISDFARRLTWSGLAPRHEWMVEHNQWKRATHAYLACVSYVDSEIGRVLDALDASPHAGHTLVVLWSDHGWALGEKQRWAKRGLWERETRVPMIIAGPEIAPGRRCDEPVGLIDLYPTLNDLCGLTAPSHLEGQSLVPQLRDVNAARDPVVTTFFENNHAVRSRRWRFIRYSTGVEELYDHATDPHEWHNLAGRAAYQSVVSDHVRHLPLVNVPTAAGSSGLGCRPEDRPLFGGVD